MAHKAPGKSFRKGLSLIDITRMFPDNEAAEQWFIDTRWPDGPRCPHCDSDRVQYPIGHKTMTHRVQGQRVPQAVQRPHRHRHGSVQPWLSGLGHRHLPVDHEPQGRVLHEAPPGPGPDPKNGVASCPQVARGMDTGRGCILRAGRSR